MVTMPLASVAMIRVCGGFVGFGGAGGGGAGGPGDCDASNLAASGVASVCMIVSFGWGLLMLMSIVGIEECSFQFRDPINLQVHCQQYFLKSRIVANGVPERIHFQIEQAPVFDGSRLAQVIDRFRVFSQ